MIKLSSLSSILVGLEVTPRNLCVTGTFTQSAPDPVAQTGCAVVMAETQKIARVSLARVHVRARRPARTPPPAFLFLQTTCQRAPRQRPHARPGVYRSVAARTKHITRLSREELRNQSGDWSPKRQLTVTFRQFIALRKKHAGPP